VQGRQQQENGKKKQLQQGAVVIKRKAASLFKDGDFIKEMLDEPRPKRAYKEGILPISSSSILPVGSLVLFNPEISPFICLESIHSLVY
jgi:hypothetical protein